jgi:hypothetical protein
VIRELHVENGVGRDLTETINRFTRSHGIVDDDTELLLIPLPRRLIDRLRGCVRVRVTHRTHGHATAYATASTLGRHPVREMRELAHA